MVFHRAAFLKFQFFHSVEGFAQLICADGAGYADMSLAGFAEGRAVGCENMCFIKQLCAELRGAETRAAYRRKEIKRSARLANLKIGYTPYPLGGIENALAVFFYISLPDAFPVVQRLYRWDMDGAV